MKISLTLFSILLLSLVFSNCSKNQDATPATTTSPTQLELTVLNSIGNVVPNTIVELYTNQTDWQNRTNQVATPQTTDVNGKVLFDMSYQSTYYWYASNGCQNNFFGTITNASLLTAHQKNSFQTVVNKIGNLKIINTSTNPYHVYINGALYGDLNGCLSYSLLAKENPYAVRVLQISGFTLYPTDKTYNINVICGNLTTVTFP